MLLSVGTALAVRQTNWLPLNWSPAMGHASSPAVQEVTKNSTYYSLTGSVTDLDTYENNLNLNQTTQLAGLEGDVSVMRDFTFSGTPNQSFDPSSGKREETYVFTGPFLNLGDSGDIKYVHFKMWGHDNVTDTRRQDPDTQKSDCLVAFKYVPKPVSGGGGE